MSTITFGRYQIRRELGRGAMGVVYEAEDPVRGLDVALKVMALPAGLSPEARKRKIERFCQEARSLEELNHPHVVRIFDQGEVGGRHFFSMELVRGTTLRDRVQLQGALSLPELLRLATELCSALDHIHQHGVIHRDIKPENIMLLPDGGAKLMDFGIAQLIAQDGTVASGGFHGSPAYMSPEQVSGRLVDARSDLYSLGITLYEAATGRRAVEGDSIPVISQKVMHEYPPPPAGLPPYFQGVLMRALAKDPFRRYASAGELAADLRAGRMPVLDLSTDPNTGAPYYVPPASVFLGADPNQPEPPRLAPKPTGLEETALEGGFLLPSRPEPPGEAAQAAPAVPPCRSHRTLPGVLTCSACRQPLCYTCFVDVPGQGVVCRACAFGTAAVLRA